uniref:Pentatricopeptide repeat-containing protein At3g61520, mitochondrial-like n=1 Tax=Nicotiana tabacum TaxID=4097 RepID=A0A1S3YTW3_TOBAC|nr:PREDICTED: pentatricopeptide repeat-containing protein At3g61520, mitochondrial-like [Nicotiana tabacum]
MQVFEKMGGRESDAILVKLDLVLYNTLIDGLCKVGRQEEGFKLIEKMRLESGYEPNTVTYCLIDSFCKASETERSYELFDQMKKGGVVPNVISLNTLLDGMCKHGKPDRYTYNTLISYFRQKEQFTTAHRVMKRMIDDGYLPNVVAYGALIHAYCLGGNVDEAIKIFQNMCSTNMPPNTIIYNTLIDALCKSDKVETSVSLLCDMKDKGEIEDDNALRTPDPSKVLEEDPFRDFFAEVDDAADLNDASNLFEEAQHLFSWAIIKFRAELSQCEAKLKKASSEEKVLRLLCSQKEQELKDLQADLAKAQKMRLS